MIPYGRQEITDQDIAEVKKVLRSDYITQGQTVPKFEQAIASYCGASYSVAVNSATSALHISCLALGLGPGDVLWTSPNTFVASANCALYCGAEIDFVDIDSKTYNMSVDALSEKLILAEKQGKLPKIVIPVHFAGQPCDMPAIYKLSKKYDFKIIEDASHAIGSSYSDIKVGSCIHSNITVFSFHPVKIITTAEGGMALTNNTEIADKLSRLRNHGITRDKKKIYKQNKNEIWNYQQIELGYNYRMNDLQAALGLSQLNRLDKYISTRHQIAKLYNHEFKDLPIIVPWQLPKTYSSFHLYPICVEKNIGSKQIQTHIYNYMHKNNINVNIHYIPVHRHPYYEDLGFKKNDYPEAEKFFQKEISLPIYPTLGIKNQKTVIELLKKKLS